MFWAGFNDLAQRILTWNKHEQRANVRRVFRELGHAPGERVLDFGCGTGLFATALADAGLKYFGYDIDERLVKFGRWLYAPLEFMHEKQAVVSHGPYDYVLANCCFHHISDEQIGGELEFIWSSLTSNGHFVLVDLLAPGEEKSAMHHLCSVIERGNFIRRHVDHIRLVEERFDVVRAEIVRIHLLSMSRSPFHTNLGVYVCRPRQAECLGGESTVSLRSPSHSS